MSPSIIMPSLQDDQVKDVNMQFFFLSPYSELRLIITKKTTSTRKERLL